MNQFREPVVVIYTPRLPEETEKEIKEKLDRALETLPFWTIYSYVTFYLENELLSNACVTNILDFPGAETVKTVIQIDLEVPYFLPRNLQTGEFVDIEKQVQCLSVLKNTRRAPKA